MAGHHHSHAAPGGVSLPHARRLTVALLIPAVLLTAVGMLLLWPRHPPKAETAAGGPAQAQGVVLSTATAACAPVPAGETRPAGCGTAVVRLRDGAQVSTELPSGPGAPVISSGDRVTLIGLQDERGSVTWSIADHQRSRELWLLGVAFVLAVIAFGRWRGLSALAGLGVTFAILLYFIVPAILDGRSPMAVAVVGSAAIMLTVLYLTHGLNVTTTIAVAGTLASLIITTVLAEISVAAVHLTGVSDDTSNFLSVSQGRVNMQGLLLASIVIGSLGVLDDITVTQSATVSELALANPAYGFRQLYGAASRIGRAHIASVINTIVLAYAGASLPLMLLFATGGTPVGDLLTGQLIAQELVRSAVGTVGLITAVPITTALAALAAHRMAAPSAKPAEPEAGRSARHRLPPERPWAASER
ncbi:membrane protein [Actinoplanes sp. SE50]|uniref:YibE/F family protein n=1 Tax=unclassified Actinoplanes TaxID=2626549 RepID=UPI00023ED532|nr:MULTISPECIES: YibE/F family protein [unclassified Actinoplanes]AEV81176.1 YibE/F family protein [Actinoplanes sp. SE50/110]ATO79577.1 membrane protein [Actinoplanes sp. SE50]SLL96978.1 membrane protein [Actinoplanes sp. SE50/110]